MAPFHTVGKRGGPRVMKPRRLLACTHHHHTSVNVFEEYSPKNASQSIRVSSSSPTLFPSPHAFSKGASPHVLLLRMLIACGHIEFIAAVRCNLHLRTLLSYFTPGLSHRGGFSRGFCSDGVAESFIGRSQGRVAIRPRDHTSEIASNVERERKCIFPCTIVGWGSRPKAVVLWRQGIALDEGGFAASGSAYERAVVEADG